VKKIIVLYSILFSSSIFCEEYNLNHADSLFNNNKYEEAITIYEEVITNNIESAELYYNLGLSYFNIQDYEKSLFYFKKSTYLKPNLDISYEKIKICNEKLNHKLYPKKFYLIWIDKLSSIFNTTNWIIICILNILIILLLSILKNLFKKRINLKLIILFLINALIIFFIIEYKNSVEI
tara:strand:- start:131 stop:667 length:537 start_codon:yes stop_codon:yes gene_type:complete